jgi:hypothetical protein
MINGFVALVLGYQAAKDGAIISKREFYTREWLAGYDLARAALKLGRL